MKTGRLTRAKKTFGEKLKDFERAYYEHKKEAGHVGTYPTKRDLVHGLKIVSMRPYKWAGEGALKTYLARTRINNNLFIVHKKEGGSGHYYEAERVGALKVVSKENFEGILNNGMIDPVHSRQVDTAVNRGTNYASELFLPKEECYLRSRFRKDGGAFLFVAPRFGDKAKIDKYWDYYSFGRVNIKEGLFGVILVTSSKKLVERAKRELEKKHGIPVIALSFGGSKKWAASFEDAIRDDPESEKLLERLREIGNSVYKGNLSREVCIDKEDEIKTIGEPPEVVWRGERGIIVYAGGYPYIPKDLEREIDEIKRKEGNKGIFVLPSRAAEMLEGLSRNPNMELSKKQEELLKDLNDEWLIPPEIREKLMKSRNRELVRKTL
jgi:hypothetical protein